MKLSNNSFFVNEKDHKTVLKGNYKSPPLSVTNLSSKRAPMETFKKPIKREEDRILPKQTGKEKFQESLDSVMFDVRLRSYAKKHGGQDSIQSGDSFQSTKLDILISSANNSNQEGGFNSHSTNESNQILFSGRGRDTNNVLQRKMNSGMISDHTKKILTKVYEIDLVPLTTGIPEGVTYNTNSNRPNRSNSNLTMVKQASDLQANYMSGANSTKRSSSIMENIRKDTGLSNYSKSNVYGSGSKANNTVIQPSSGSFHEKKSELYDMLATNKKDRMTMFEQKKTTVKTKLTHLSELNHKENHKLLGTGNYIKQSLSNLKRTFNL